MQNRNLSLFGWFFVANFTNLRECWVEIFNSDDQYFTVFEAQIILIKRDFMDFWFLCFLLEILCLLCGWKFSATNFTNFLWCCLEIFNTNYIDYIDLGKLTFISLWSLRNILCFLCGYLFFITKFSACSVVIYS